MIIRLGVFPRGRMVVRMTMVRHHGLQPAQYHQTTISKCWHPCMLYVPTLTQPAASHTCTFLRGKLAVSGVVEQLIWRFEIKSWHISIRQRSAKHWKVPHTYVNELKTLLYLLFLPQFEIREVLKDGVSNKRNRRLKIEVFNV